MGDKRERRFKWREVQEICELDPAEVAMAQRLNVWPNTVIRASANSFDDRKPPVDFWIHDMYMNKFGPVPYQEPPLPVELRLPFADALPVNENWPWPDDPEIPELTYYNPSIHWDNDYDCFDDPDGALQFNEPPDISDASALRRQRAFRWAAQSIAILLDDYSTVEKVSAFGSVALPLSAEASRCLHYCKDLDLAIWLTKFENLRGLRTVIGAGVRQIEELRCAYIEPYEVDVHLFDFESGEYRGRLCFFSDCPKRKRWECRVPGCGKRKFLRKLWKEQFNPPRFAAEPKVILLDRASDFLVNMPMMEAPPPIIWQDDLDDYEPCSTD